MNQLLEEIKSSCAEIKVALQIYQNNHEEVDVSTACTRHITQCLHLILQDVKDLDEHITKLETKP